MVEFNSMERIRTILFLIFSIFSIVSHAAELEMMNDRLGIPEVSQREYIQTSYNAHEYVQTYGMYTCVGLVIYNKEKQEAILAHVDAATNVEKEVARLIEQIGEDAVVSLIGGTEKLAKRISNVVVSKGLSVDLRVEEIENIIVSLRDGQIYQYDESQMTTSYAVMDAKLDRMHFGGKRLFRHMDSLGGGDYLELSQESSTPFSFRPF